ncbi:MAG: asparagine synthase (glutamine-hydrolyzing) [Acidobacteria bacterium]|nr:asparagine synthase (glutamine-hydrolyzing) [Acidobacteriota bacterium]
MCGIAGFTHKNTRPTDGRIRDATLALVHRGPDEQDVWEDQCVSLGAVRLKIIDLTGGSQPMVAGDGQAVIVFNGEIYNHAELRRELESRGHRFRSRCDTEVVLHAFLEWDVACFTRLRGMFAAALWQPERRRLLLVRDRMGIKPLYFHRRGQDLYFGSELKAILEHPEIERRIDPGGLGLYLSLNYVPGPYTLAGGIRKLPPGHWLEWRDGEVRTGAYWRLQFEPRQRPLEEAKEELDFLLRESVREHLLSDVPLGVWASGGIDSSTILHYAAQASASQLKTFSVSFRGRSFDESPYFREVARAYGTDHHEFDLNPEKDLEEAIQELAFYSDEPSADAGALPVWFLSKMSRRHVTVALSGEGADELFGGYYTYLADSLVRPLRHVPAVLRRAALRALSLWPVSDDKIGFEYKLKRFLAGSLLDPAAAHFFWNGTFSESDRQRLLAANGCPPLASLAGALPAEAERLDPLNRFLWLDQLYYLPDDILYKCDRMSMAHSLEVRPPFLDHRIVEFAAALPMDMKVRGSRLKFLLKELMRDKLPPSILARRKEGFDIPAHDWLRGGLRPLVEETLSPQALRRSGLFRAGAVEEAVRAHMERRANLGYHLWGLLVLFLWMKRWGIESLEAQPQDSEPAPGFASAINS